MEVAAAAERAGTIENGRAVSPRTTRRRGVGRILARIALLLAVLLARAPAAWAGEVLQLDAPSTALGRPIPYSLYRPEPAPPEGVRWPVLYLFHGLGGNQRDWVEVGRAAETLDRLIGTGAIAPLLVVMPMAGDTWYVDNPDPGGAGAMAQALSKDLVAHVDASQPALACRTARAVGGLSMGGYGALLYAFDAPGKFAAAISLSGSIFPPMPSEAALRAGRPVRMFGRVFGDPFDWQRFNAANLFLRIPRLAQATDRPALYLAVGDADFPRLMEGNASFTAALGAAGLPVHSIIDQGHHDWGLWSSQLGPALEWLDRVLVDRC